MMNTEAIKNDTMEPPDYVFKDFWSEGLTVDEKMGPYLRSMDVSYSADVWSAQLLFVWAYAAWRPLFTSRYNRVPDTIILLTNVFFIS